MATTAIWNIKGRIDIPAKYGMNPDKTLNPDWEKAEQEALNKAYSYIGSPTKTEHQYYVTGLNCSPAIAVEQMMGTKRRFGKLDGNTAYHGYQSFAPGEVTAEQAHEIGVKLAKKLWGDRFEVIVSTHLDKEHLHNHFLLNSVSFIDGRKYNDCKETYRLMRRTSDELCREYRLSVIEHPKQKGKHYAEWAAEKESRDTWRTVIREDIDRAIRESMSYPQFLRRLRDNGYTVVTTVKHTKIRPPGKERFVRLYKLGKGYTEEDIQRRILNQRHPDIPRNRPPLITRRRFRGIFCFSRPFSYRGLKGLYLHYLYLLRKYQRQKRPSPAAYPLREDRRRLSLLCEQARFLCGNRIETGEELQHFQQERENDISRLLDERREIANEKRRLGISPERLEEISKRSAEITAGLKALRREVRLCDGIAERSALLRSTLKALQMQEIKERKERIERGNRGRGGGSSRNHEY